MKLLFIALLLIASTASAQQSDAADSIHSLPAIVINEIMAANVDVYRDPSTNFGSWVELYNPTDTDIDLGGLYVSDTPDNLRKHRLIPTYGTLPAGGFAILNFDHYEVWTLPSYRQIDDKLDCDGGTIIISDGESILAHQDYPQAVSRVSYARTTDGGDTWGTTAYPTPGASNATSLFASRQLAAPEVDVKGRLFETHFLVHVTIPEGATLYCTTDGSTPSENNGALSLTGIFRVDTTSIYRFRLYKDGCLPSPVTTCSYIYKDRDYTLPIISVVSDEANFTSPEYGIRTQGINGRPGKGMTEPANWNMEWERPVNFEYITTDNQCVISQECDYTPSGAWTRRPVSWTAMGGISFKLKADKAYEGQNSFDYQFFEDKPFIKHKNLLIRQGGNDSKGRLIDPVVQEVIRRSGIDVETQCWQPVHHFVNGIYKGVINLREPNNRQYAYSNYGLDAEDIDMFEVNADSGYVQVRGTEDAFCMWYELSKEASKDSVYAQIRDIVDIDEYINYMAIRLYLGGTDWPHNNVKAFRDVKSGKFRFVIFDLDYIGNSNNPLSKFFSSATYTYHELYGTNYATGECLDGKQITQENRLVTIFGNMLKNATFRKRFIDTFCIIGGSVFNQKRATAIIREKAKMMQEAMQGEEDADPQASAQSIIDILTGREAKMVKHLTGYNKTFVSSKDVCEVTIDKNNDHARLQLNSIEVPYGCIDGHVTLPATIKAIAPAGYRFVGWKSENGIITSTEEELALSTMSSKRVYTAIYEPISANTVTAIACAPITINEVSAANTIFVNDYHKKSDWLELYNATDKDIDIAGMYLSDNHQKPQKYQIPLDDERLNTVIPARGYKVVWCDKKDNLSSAIHAPFKLDADSGVVLISNYNSDSLIWADTLAYASHSGTETFGRYPDGSRDTYLMTRPTIAAANMLTSYSEYMYIAPPMDETPEKEQQSDSILVDIAHNVAASLRLAYVAGVLNVKSVGAGISSVRILSTSGTNINVQPIRHDSHYMTYSLGAIPPGIYIATVTDVEGNTATLKFMHSGT